MKKFENIVYKNMKVPNLDCTNIPVMLSDETMEERYNKILQRMEEENIESLIVYADLEHGNNFEYLTGFLPRFEEALLVINKDSNNYMIMGNENLNKVPFARIKAKALHAPYFSLPNQPMDNNDDFATILRNAEIIEGKRVGIAGWKRFTSRFEDNSKLLDIPAYIVDEVRRLVGKNGQIVNATDIFIGDKGARCVNNVNEIEHYEFGASLASDCMLKAMNRLDINVSEMDLGNELNAYGQKNSVVTVASSGRRFIKANLYPTENTVKSGDPISLTVGYKGGLSSRVGYAVKEAGELPKEVEDYIDVIVKPYYNAVVTWLENVQCGLKGKDIYQLINQVLPKAEYHWSLCPGHLTADEEWMSSPIYEGSDEVLRSGMIFQIDIIPSIKGYAGTSAESTVVLADEELRQEIQKCSPGLWKRIIQRRNYIEQELNIQLNKDILPMCSTVAYLRPFLLNKNKAMSVK